jgi:phage shock protein A
MSFFSRLSDIISCKLDDLLAEAGEPASAIARVVAEIEEGLNGARRSVQAATNSEKRLQGELDERNGQVAYWGGKAREELLAGREDGARHALSMKRETEDLAAGLQQQLAAAASTREHLTTTLRAIEARLAEARRRQTELTDPAATLTRVAVQKAVSSAIAPATDNARAAQIEAELEALRRELKGAG